MNYCVSILYPNKPHSRFDFDYYVNKHIPMTQKIFGKSNVEIRKGIFAPGDKPVEFICIAQIRIKSIDTFIDTMTNHGSALIADIPNYTDIAPVIQIDEVLVETSM